MLNYRGGSPRAAGRFSNRPTRSTRQALDNDGVGEGRRGPRLPLSVRLGRSMGIVTWRDKNVDVAWLEHVTGTPQQPSTTSL